MTCDAVLNAGSENFGVINGNVTFNNGSANRKTVTGNATFNGNSENKYGAIVSGNATFNGTSVNAGTVTGNATIEVTATNSGTVTGTVTVSDSQFDAWLASRNNPLPEGHTATQQYSGPGPKNGKWFYMQNGPFENKANALDSEYNYTAWLSNNTGVNSFVIAGGNPVNAEATHYGQWAYNSTEYGSETAALAAEEAAYQAWLIANSGVNQYGGTGPHNGQWAYNQTEYASQAEAQAAYDANNPQ